jgi:antitoxin (DNA-binding transcriptional repressor) of toxin-antitoxin stability system
VLRQVQAGKRFTLTNRGKPVADLILSESAPVRIATLAIDRFLAFKTPSSETYGLRQLR